MSLPSIFSEWCLEDRGPLGDSESWYVLSPWGGECGPFTEDAAAAKLLELRAHPVWCPACLVPMVQDHDYVEHKFNALWRCPSCNLAVDQDEIARIIRVNE